MTLAGFLVRVVIAAMPSSSQVPHSLKLELADGQRWLIRPVDDRAAAVVAELGTVMCLSPGEVGRELCVAVCKESDRFDVERGGAVVCRLAVPTDRATQVAQMRRIASQIAREALFRGGLLFHGALAEYRGSAFIMAGPGDVGKSTASRRLPSPWRSLCDDMTLVVRDCKGRFWAHPWPTWSRFNNGGPGGSWAVEQAVPLRAQVDIIEGEEPGVFGEFGGKIIVRQVHPGGNRAGLVVIMCIGPSHLAGR